MHLLAALLVAASAAAAPESLTGVLVLPDEHPWGVYFEPGFSWEWARSERQEKYRLLAGGRVYVPAFAPAGSSQAEPAAARTFGVTEPVHLVELGGEPVRGPHLAVRSLRILDGLPEIPWTLAGKLRELRDRFDALRIAQRAAVDGEFRRARERLRARPGGRILRDLPAYDLVIYRPAWLPNARRLEVFFAYKRQAGFWIKSAAREPRGNVKYAPTPPERGVSFAAILGARYVVDAGGRVVEQEEFPPGAFDQAEWTRRVLASGRDDTPPAGPVGVELVLEADRPRLRPGDRAVFTLRLANRSSGPVWTNPSLICTGSWDLIVRDPRGTRVRVDDRDAMGCPSGGLLGTRIGPGHDAKLSAGWDGHIRPRLGTSHPAPPGRYTIEVAARWSDREGTPNANGPRAYIAPARTALTVLE
ncbi:MAG: hypothetical protein AAB152_05115 [Candidatus Coatesbacteria bacterium]